jgi:hypothetical protein
MVGSPIFSSEELGADGGCALLGASTSRLTTSWSERGMDKLVLGMRGQRVAQLRR